ncbi:hypothetical protein LXL04_018242 [Taraxacum kok-saghyz]
MNCFVIQQDLNDHPSSSKYSSVKPPPPSITNDQIINAPPEKKTRVPSAYNQFIKQEIQRIKVSNPNISHREAFSAAAKNWAHFPHIHFGLMLEGNNHQAKIDELIDDMIHMHDEYGVFSRVLSSHYCVKWSF